VKASAKIASIGWRSGENMAMAIASNQRKAASWRNGVMAAGSWRSWRKWQRSGEK
jgi:hypothetical protein